MQGKACLATGVMGLCVQRCLGWVCRSWCWPWKHCCFNKALLGGWFYIGWLSDPSQAWTTWMPGALLAQGSPLAAPNQVERGLFLETRNALHEMITVSSLHHLDYSSAGDCEQSPSACLSLRLASVPAVRLVGSRVYEQVVCLYDTVVVWPQGILLFLGAPAPATLPTLPYQQAQ